MSKLDSGSGELPTNSCSLYDDRIYAIVAAVSAASGFISLLASCFIIFIIILFKKWGFFSQRLVFYLALAGTLQSLSVMVQRVDYENQTSTPYKNFCVFAGFFSQVAGWMLLNSIVSITFFLLLKVFSCSPEKIEPLFILFIFIFPLTFNWVPFIDLTYGKAGAWCWIRSEDENCNPTVFGMRLQLGLWYIPLYVSMLMLIVMYTIILVKLYHKKRQWTGKFEPQVQQTKEKMKNEIIPLLAYPLIFFICEIPATINRIYGLFTSEPQPVLWFLTGIIFPLEGGIIALAFSLDPETRRRLTVANFRAAFRELCFCKGKKVKEYPAKDGIEASITVKRTL